MFKKDHGPDDMLYICDDPERRAQISENDFRLRGPVTEVHKPNATEPNVVIAVQTTKEVQGDFYDCIHVVKVRRTNKAFGEVCATQKGDILSIKGAIHQDKSVIPFLFYNETARKRLVVFNTDYSSDHMLYLISDDEPERRAQISENDFRLRGPVIEVYIPHATEPNVVITVQTTKKVQNEFYDCTHVVKVRRSNRSFTEACATKEGDILSIKGAIHQDRSVLPFLFYNETARKQHRVNHLVPAVVAQRRQAT